MERAQPERLETVLAQAMSLPPDQRSCFLAQVCAGDALLQAEVEIRLRAKDSSPALPALAAAIPGSEETVANNGSNNHSDSNAKPCIDPFESLVLEAVVDLRNPGTAHISNVKNPTGNRREAIVIVEPNRESPPKSDPPGLARPSEMVGRWIGPYCVVNWIGDCGAGTVYRATGGEQFAHDVAITLFNRGIDSEVIRQRLKTETPIHIALRKCPNIVPIEDAGTALDGLTYVATEYVTGQPIDEYCDKQQLDVPARLMLFAQVSEAVHFAHQYAVIHGDLKPKSILVTERGVPKLLGFGIAKLLRFDAGRDEKPTDATSQNPRYMSPEQVQGEVITTACDIYSLGVILYEILSGHWPYQLKISSTPEILQAVCEQVPERPSKAIIRQIATQVVSSPNPSELGNPTSMSQKLPPGLTVCPELVVPKNAEEIAEARSLPIHRLQQILRNDLDAIVLMAIRKEPEQRYRSAEQFADDLYRYLKSMPVRAQRDSWAYRTRKFVQRHSMALSVWLVSSVALVIGIIGTTSSAILARYERDRIAYSFDNARNTVNHILTRVTEESLLDQSPTHPLRESLLLDIRHFYEDFLRQYSADYALRGELALACTHVARIARLTGTRREAVAYYGEAVALWENLVAEQPHNQEYQGILARTLNEFSAVLIPLEGRLEEAASMNRRACELAESVIADNPQSARYRHELSLVLLNSAEIDKIRGESNKAVKDLEHVVDIETQLVAENPQSLAATISLANAHSALGQFLAGQSGNLLQSLESCSQAIRLRDAITQEHSDLVDQSYRLALDLSALSRLQQKLKQPESACHSLNRSLEISERINQYYPDVINYNETLGTSYNAMSDLLRQRSERAEALIFARKANKLFERMVAKHAKNTSFPLGLAQSHNLIGRFLKEDGQLFAALQSFRRAIDLYESLPEIDPQNSYNLACNLALCIPLIGIIDGSSSIAGRPQALSKGDWRRCEVYGDRAIKALRSAAKSGLLDSEMLEGNPDLNSVRVRADFRSLAKQVDEKRMTDGK